MEGSEGVVLEKGPQVIEPEPLADALPISSELFRTDDLLVREVSGFSQDRLVVTFDSYTDLRDLDRPGFGEAFLRRHGIDAVHVISRDNRWYQYRELPEAAAIVRRIAQRYARTISYGSSMGGYAAIRFGRSVGASAALALSPQFSIDPAVAPFERRWADDAESIDFVLERDWKPGFVETSYVFYDLYDLDRRHADLFAQHTNMVPVVIPNAGHPCTGFLAEIGLLQTAVLDLAHGSFDPARFRRDARARRSTSAQFFLALAARARRPERKVALTAQAVQFSPGNPAVLMRHALTLSDLGRIAEGKAVCAQALALNPEDPVRLCEITEFFIRIGHWERARAMMEDIVRRWPAVPVYKSRLMLLLSLIEHEAHRAKPPPAEIPALSRRIGALWRRLPPRRSRRAAKTPPVEVLVTTSPAPPPFVTSWRRHTELMNGLPRRPVDLLLVGDSLVQYWPTDLWKPFRVFNFGIAADKTQHTLWRLNQVFPHQLAAERVLILLGTNNLAADDGAEAIVEGIRAVVQRLGVVAVRPRCYVIEIPPLGPDFGFRADERRRTNQLLRRCSEFQSMDVDELITTGFAQDCTNYHEDRIHFSDEGYRVLTRSLYRRIC